MKEEEGYILDDDYDLCEIVFAKPENFQPITLYQAYHVSRDKKRMLLHVVLGAGSKILRIYIPPQINNSIGVGTVFLRATSVPLGQITPNEQPKIFFWKPTPLEVLKFRKANGRFQ